MEIARRGLLGLTAAIAVSAATSSCRGDRETGPRSTPSSRPSPGSTELPATPAFAGQPPPGSMYYGASVPHGRSLTAWEEQLGTTLALHRSYFTPDHNETDQLVRRCRDDLANDRLPHVSIKPIWTWADIASGHRNDWLDGMLRPLGELAGPVILTLHHEPENDSGATEMAPSDYVAMQRRLLEHAAALAPEVIVVPVLQHWTFDPLGAANEDESWDARAWIVPEAPVIGLDVYNPWSPMNGKEWRSFGSKMDEVLGWFGETPLLIGEYGCREDPENPGLATEWLRDAAEYGRTHNFVSMSYFNSGVQSPDGTWALQGETEQAFAELLSSDWVARPA